MTWDEMVEARIREAMERGEFDDLPGTGKPLELDDDLLVPEELRVAYRILKNGGFVPPEIDARREIVELCTLLENIDNDGERRQALARLNLLRLRLDQSRTGRPPLSSSSPYYLKIVERLARKG